MTWAELIAHAKAERDAFKKRATFQRKEWLRARKERRWLDALNCKSREQEYRNSAAERNNFVEENLWRIK